MKKRLIRPLCLLLTLCLLGGCSLTLAACSGRSEVPDGYQYATCKGEYFRLFVPTQWRVSTESGVSGATLSLLDSTAVSMAEVYFEPEEGEATLDAFVADHLEKIGKMTAYTAEKSFDASVNRHRAKDITYTAEVAGVTYRYRQLLTKVEGRFYLFTFSSTADTFERYLDIVDGIIENIVFYAVPFEGSEDERKLPSVKDTPAGMKLVSDNDVVFRFFAPEDWVTVPGSAAYQVCASETDRSNVSVLGYIPTTDSPTYGVDEYWKEAEKQYRDAFQDFTLVSTEKSKMGGLNATVYEYTYAIGGVQYHARQTACVFSYMMVIMTYTALEENYATHLAEAKAMQDALYFRKNIGQGSNNDSDSPADTATDTAADTTANTAANTAADTVADSAAD